ncbi:MAG: hypothetical protein BGP14_01735 [Sphingobacteriales bacterium 44-15]|nr:MAG: hypothetical protein BGP14_01735 [Sphingobacteriales bacterium 44-15]
MFTKNRRKIIAAFFLAIFSTELLSPVAVRALTSGPSQPEITKFEAAGVNDLVDLFTGDLKYNIPLLDVGGYPINLSYQSGTGMEDEASWVGAGWSLNPGAINRTMRGLPDDFNGNKSAGVEGDKIRKQYKKREFKKVGGQIVLKPSLFAWEFGSASLKLNVYKDNYFGIGASVGASLGFHMTQNSSTPYTAGLDIDVNSDVRDGVGISPTLSLTKMYDAYNDGPAKVGLSGGLHYNTRSGLKSVSLSASYNSSKEINEAPANLELTGVHYFGQTYTPVINANTSNTQYAFNFDGGVSLFGGYLGYGGGGYVYNEKILDKDISVPAYGYLNYLKGRKNTNALLDFNREKDGVFITSAPSIPTPVATQDFFTATSQTGSQQFRPYFAGNYIVYDRQHNNPSIQASAGVTIGGGWIYKGGARVEGAAGSATTGKWITGNNYIVPQEAAYNTVGAMDEPLYFKQVGDPAEPDNLFIGKAGTATEQVVLAGGITSTSYKNLSGTRSSPVLKRDVRDRRNYVLTYLTALQAKKYGLDKTINGDPRVDGVRKAHHISEMTVTDNEGKRMVYGIPVYNIKQEEATFAIVPPTTQAATDDARRTGTIGYTTTEASDQNQSGRDQLYMKETTPPYATSFLLTGILSPDYVDVTGDGISDDDLGTAVKFSYKKQGSIYKWRAPYTIDANKGNYNEGFLSDKNDDRANYVYGEKELWYLDKIESKTMIAVFHTSPREDGLGVSGEDGGRDINRRQEKLDKIELFSKADYIKNGSDAKAIKTVYFEYDYSLYPEVPNNSGNAVMVNDKDINLKKGKLTLKKVYFTFGKNSRGESNPYEFEYDERLLNDHNAGFPTIPGSDDESTDPPKDPYDKYLPRQSDRWGTYKKSFYNRVVNGNRVLNNSEFPYTIQEDDATSYSERELADRLASKWQLTQIATPTGSKISVEYESDDYAYVQNRRAMQMCFVEGITSSGNATGLGTADKLAIHLPKAVSSATEFKDLYLKQPDGSLTDKIFFKVFANIDNNPGHYDYVYGYAALDLANCTASGNTAFIALKKVDGYNPVAKAAWQMLRTDLPQLAYDNYDNTNVADGAAAIKSIVSAIGNLREIIQPFEKRAINRKFSDRIDLNKSMVRLNNPDMKKIGGGARVKMIQISDEWFEMNGKSNLVKGAKYGQVYDYALRDRSGNFIASSGVASYEPQIGNEENPFHEPVSFTEKVHWANDRQHFIEKPYCETYFPGASVGYSKVRVTAIGDDYQPGSPLIKHTGYIENEFYTARDFPTIVENLTLDKKLYENNLILKLFSATSIKRMATSQGFKIELNDMHGKPKATTIYNKGGDVVSSSEYFYKVKDENAAQKELNNEVQVLRQNGSIATTTIATDIDVITDVRESKNESTGGSVGGYSGGLQAWVIYIPYVAVNISPSITRDTYNSISMVKVVQQYGILSKTRTTQNGSTIEAENLLWDSQTGQVLLTRTQNAFDQYQYAFNYPAYMAYEGMSAAYKNIGATFSSFTIGANGSLAAYSSYLFPGDELGMVNEDNTVKRLWVIKSNDGSLRAVDENGEFVSGSGTFSVLRSGRRNILSAGAGTVLLSKDPRTGGDIDLTEAKQILDAKAVVYKDQWAVPVNRIPSTQTGPDPGCSDMFCILPFFYAAFTKVIQRNSATDIRRGIFAVSADNLTAYNYVPHCDPFHNGRSATEFDFSVNTLRYTTSGSTKQYYFNAGDVIKLGNYQVVIDAVDAAFKPFINQDLDELEMGDVFNNLPKCTVYLNNGDGNYAYEVPTYQVRGNGCNFTLDEVIGDCSASVPPGTHPENLDQYLSFKHLLTFHVVTAGGQEKICLDPVDKVINPYVKGILGNWRPYAAYVYTVNRSQPAGDPLQQGGTDIRIAGYYSSYNPFWTFQSTGLINYLSPGVDIPSHDNRWVWNTKSIYFDQKGNEIENVDPLNRYGSVLFGYQQSLAVAVGANARRNEIAFDGFEDYDFSLGSTEDCPPQKHFDFDFVESYGDWSNASGRIISTKSHTGNYCYELSSELEISRTSGSSSPSDNILGYTSGKYKLLANELAKGFAPVQGKKYLLSVWVNDHVPNDNKIQNLQVQLNGTNIPVSSTVVPVVEGWKRLDIPFTGGASFALTLNPTSIIEIDDLRILPYDGQLNTYVYDNRTLRLMAQLDENNFATLFEYDDEGTPIRVKKETERGIMTLKENRQSFKGRSEQ